MDYLFESLTKNIKSHSNVILMTHKHPDLDGMSCCIALSKVISSFKKSNFVVFPNENVNESLKKGFKLLEDNNISIPFMKSDDILRVIDDNSLLIVLDIQNPDIVESPILLDRVNDIFVIDHHTNSSNHIENALFEYINSNKSSTVEIIAEYLKYLNKKLNPIIITLMAAGMEIDTHSYSLKTTEETFRMAGFLTRLGADPILKKDLLKESMDDVMRRHDYIKNSFMIRPGFLMCDMGSKEDFDPIDLAILADELLRFDGVDVSFAVGRLNKNTVGVSARSMGKISVSNIMAAIGGGGHVTDAAAQIKNKSNEEVIEMIKNVCKEV